MKTMLLGMLAATAVSGAALAQSSTTVTTTSPSAGSSFYIVQDASTKRCTVTRERPTTKTMTVVGGDGTLYKSETEAQSALKTTKICTTD
jgi:hypothetical protein